MDKVKDFMMYQGGVIAFLKIEKLSIKDEFKEFPHKILY